MAATITRTLRNVGEVVVTTAQQLPKRRVVTLAVAIVILVALALLVPLPTAVQLRDWSRSLGPWFPLAFLAAHTVITVFPFPRTAFTLAAGLLFGTGYGVLIAVTASTVSALIALLLVRAGGWQLSSLVSHPAIETVDSRLRQRGWLAVLSLRLIPAVPFAVINYAAGASAVRIAPYGLATLVGPAGHCGGGDPGRRVHRQCQPDAGPGVSGHGQSGSGRTGLRDPQAPAWE